MNAEQAKAWRKALDDAVRLRLDALLSEDEELHWQLLDERIAKWKKDTARPAQGVANTQAELARIDGEVERLVAALAAGSRAEGEAQLSRSSGTTQSGGRPAATRRNWRRKS